MLRKNFYPKIEPLLNRIAVELNARGFSPNQLTLAGLALSFLTGCIFATGAFFLGGLFLLISSFADMLDGPLARVSNRATPFGAFLDSTLDRYSDFFIFGGLALCFARQDQGTWLLVSLGILAGAFVTSYAKARAESLIPSCPVGLFERPERILALALGAIVWPLLPLTLWVLLIGTNWTAIERIFYTQKALLPHSSSDSE